MKPSIGRIVHYVDMNKHYPAIVVAVYENEIIDLTMFGSPGCIFLSRIQHAENFAQSSWHWPEREE